MKNGIKVFAVILCVLSAAFIFEANCAFANGRCVFCGSQAYGKNCPGSPHINHAHEHDDDYRHCVFCGSTAYGRKCLNAPKNEFDNFFDNLTTMLTGDLNNMYGYHQHGSGGGRCVFCGSSRDDTQCQISPNKQHYY